MAFPSVRGSPATTGLTNGASSIDVLLPATIEAGDTLVIWIRTSTGATAYGFPGGWTVLVNEDEGAAGTDRIGLAYKKADGTEDGTTVNVTTPTSKSVAIAWAIQNAADPTVMAPEISTKATGTTDVPDPTTCTPTGGAKDYLWLWLGSWEGEQTSPPASNPTNYSSDKVGVDTGTGGAVTSNCRAASVTRQNNAASEDAGSWQISAADNWSAFLMAFHPAAAAFSDYEILGRPYGQSGERQMQQLLAT